MIQKNMTTFSNSKINRPVEDQYKVLAIDESPWEHKVLVVGKDRAWREAPCVACPHVSHTKGLHMNGTVYYGATKKDINFPNNSIIVCFDVRLETFNIIKVPSKVLTSMGYQSMWFRYPWADTSDNGTDKTLINYRGKIGVVENPRLKGSFRMWVVEDAEKEEWSISTFHLPESADLDFMVMDTFSSGEICLVPRKWSYPFCLYYYNWEKKSIRSVRIEGLPVSEFRRAETISVTVSDHYESLMFLKTCKLIQGLSL
ncbi:hypothetical protein EUTSA_v10010959mg [Eutrema salsugineum]|uniref:F-box associated beta-propeller type 3 domain-containing protein n=1 Tax=Eutrema salsugineum TaxID=72664 RepID=V4LTQ9_EUTSA|nr:hypothetical protein EUTSA_v10010959mg [Eutrema salsugineum]